MSSSSSNSLVIDCQILQTPALDRGMGKYTLSLLRAFLKTQKHYSRIELLLNSNLNTDKGRVNYIKEFTGTDQIVLLDLPTDISKNCKDKHHLAAEAISQHIESISGRESVDFLITSPFFVEFPTAFPRQDDVRKFVIAYDIIPQKIWHLLRIFPDDIYFHHFGLYLEADRIFTISHAVKGDLVELVGINPRKITPIDGGPFEKATIKDTEKIELKKPFIIYPSAPIAHKNNERAIRAFNKLNEAHDSKYTLYITSTFDDDVRQRLKLLSGKVKFTGNVSDHALAYAYSQADVLFFPSLSEGLGMPVLEALNYDTPVACSNIPVLTELSKDAFYQFDATDERDMARALGEAIAKTNWKERQKAVARAKAKYTWERSAKLLMEGIKKPSRKTNKRPAIQIRLPKPDTDSPAAILGELCYARLHEQYEQIGLTFTKVRRQAGRPSYMAQMPESIIPGAGAEMIFKDIKSLTRLGRRRKLTIVLKTETNTSRITLYAARIFSDKALQLEGWGFTDSNGLPVKPQTLLSNFDRD